MSVFSRSAPRCALQLLSFLFAGLAIASGWTSATTSLSGVDYWTAAAALVVIELGALVGASYLGAGVRQRKWLMAATACALAAICIGNAGSNGLNYAWGKYELQRSHRADDFKKFTTARDTADRALARVATKLEQYDSVRLTSDIDDAIAKCDIEGCKTKVNNALAEERRNASERDSLLTAQKKAQSDRNAVVAVVGEHSAVSEFAKRLLGWDQNNVDLGCAVLYVALIVLAAPLTAGLAQFADSPESSAESVRSGAGAEKDGPGAAQNAVPALPPISKPALPQQHSVLHSVAVSSPAPAQPRRASVPSVPAQRPAVPRSASGRAEQIAKFVELCGGELRSTYAEIERKIGMHQVTIGHAIKEAVDAGWLLRESSSKGTVLRLTPAYSA